MDDAIRCTGLTKRYGATTAVGGLDLVVAGAQVFGLLGPNGSGKTTTLRMLLGLVRPTSGRVWIHGRQLPDPEGLARIGAVIEEPAFYPWASGRRNLELLALSGPPPPRGDAVQAALDRAGLGAAAGRRVGTYSQGMRQRLGLAAALLRDPALLLLDEPTNGMDPAGIRDLRSLLRELAQGGTTVVLSSHLLSEVEQVCDRVAVLSAGRLVAQGPVTGPGSEGGTRVRVAVDPEEVAEARQVLSGWTTRSGGPGRLLVEGAEPREVNQTLGRAGLWAHELTHDQARLEERFLHLTTDDPVRPPDPPRGASDAAAAR